MSDVAISLGDVSKRFGARWALRRVSFEVKAGEAVMLAGHNGSGKTTLLRIVAAAARPTFGEVRVHGVSSKDDPMAVRRSVSLLSHASGHYEDLSAEENLRVHARVLGVDERQVQALLERVGLSARKKSNVRQFSAGMKKRLAIARLMLKSPPVVLLDEPFGELDPDAMAATEEWVRALRKEGRTVLLATHWLDQGRRLTDRALNLRDGTVVA